MMSAPGRGSALLRSSQLLCSQCARSSRTIPRLPLSSANTAWRYYASEATNPSPSEPSSSTTTPPPPPVTSNLPKSPNPYRIKSGVILSRPPILTRDPTPFESAFYLYQKRLNERLTAPFRREFYYKPDSAADLDFRIKLKERHGVPAKDIGRYNPRGRMAWNDEVMIGSTTSSWEYMYERLLKDAEVRVSEDGEPIPEEERVPVERPMPRRTEADEKNDVRRLDRALDKTLYLVVKKGEGENAVWGFPEGPVLTEEALHETAARVLAESAGINMNTWIVGRVPIAHHVIKPEFEPADANGEQRLVKRGEKIFFLKGRIMAGQADLTDNKHGLTDFQWLTRDELRKVLPYEYWWSVRNSFDLR